MSITMADPGRFVVHATYARDDGSTWDTKFGVVAFDERGTPLVRSDKHLVSPDHWLSTGWPPQSWYLDQVDRAIIPAAPGWVVDQLDDVGERYSLPVIAWIHELGGGHREHGLVYWNSDAGGKAICVYPHNPSGDVALEEVDLTQRGVCVRPGTVQPGTTPRRTTRKGGALTSRLSHQAKRRDLIDALARCTAKLEAEYARAVDDAEPGECWAEAEAARALLEEFKA